ncbi:MAG: BolA/IbaG family iron-sulfur metabolism protein [Chlamydiia bacterium]|nr:BolA/IbaG family iron-sulfur metabolism protein [Chlamydiia bacterium]
MNPQKDGLHFDAIVISSLFSGKSLVEQHQMVMAPLKELFDSKLHALSLKTYTPEEWNEGKR